MLGRGEGGEGEKSQKRKGNWGSRDVCSVAGFVR